MKIVIILTGGRSGSDFLQSLFDGHPEIMQFPGILEFTNKFLSIFNKKKSNEIANFFITMNKQFFDSRINKIERHDKLGSKKNKFYKVDKKLFVKKFVRFFEKSKKNNFDLIVCLHKAYSNNIKNKKIIILHIHLFEFLKNYLKIFKIDRDHKFLLTLRDPLVSMCSTINHWLNYKKGIHLTPRNLFTNIDLHFNNFNNLFFLRKKIKVIKLENLHKQGKVILKKICKYIDIKYSNILLKSSYHKKKWWGDSISKKNLNGLNKNFKNKFDTNLFSNKEIFFLENKIEDIIKKYNYPKRSSKKYKNKSYFSPFKFEIKVWLNTFKHKKIKTILSILYFYCARLILLNKKNLFSLNDLPNEI